MKTPLFFAILLTLMACAGCGSKSDDPAPGPNPSLDPTTAILRTWKKTAFTIRTDRGEYKATQIPKQFQTITFAKDGTYVDGGLGLNGTYRFRENNTILVLVESPTPSTPAGYTYNTFITFQGTTAFEMSSLVVAVNPAKQGANTEEVDIARIALNYLNDQTAINPTTVKSVQIVQRFEAQ
ncbi:MAG: hypothetical protein LH606_16715 [Cytophagaceae bacterium]|nr:hypothetical protein [Cytophagaceae bacterium]